MTQFQAIPIKFTLMGVSSDVNDQILDFRDAMMKEFKNMLTLISFDIEGMKFTDVKERFLDDNDGSLRKLVAMQRSAIKFAYIEDNDEETETFNLYYDIIAVLSNSSILPGPTVVKAVRQNRLEILQQMHEYKSEYYYYIDDFDLCTTSREEEKAASAGIHDTMFNLCTYDHQLVDIIFAALGLPSDMDRDIFIEELMEIYGEILHDVDGLIITGIYPVKQEQTENKTNFYFDLNVLQKDNQNMKPVITKKLYSDDGMSHVLNRVQKYTDKEGRGLKWCITDDGQYSTEPCVAAPSKWYDMPVWKIVTITVSVVIIFGIGIWVCIIVRQRAKEAKEFKGKVRECESGQNYCYDERRRKHKKRHHSNARYSRPHARREERRHHHRHHQPYREATRHRQEYSVETLSDVYNDEPPRCLVPDLPYRHHQQQKEKLQVEPWQQSKLPKRQQDVVDVKEGHRQRSYSVYPATQRSQPKTKQQHELKTEQGGVYCDEKIVNRPDPLAKLEKSVRR